MIKTLDEKKVGGNFDLALVVAIGANLGVISSDFLGIGVTY